MTERVAGDRQGCTQAAQGGSCPIAPADALSCRPHRGITRHSPMIPGWARGIVEFMGSWNRLDDLEKMDHART